MFTEKDCESVYELVYSSHRLVAQAAAEFLHTKLFSRTPEESTVQKTRRGKVRSRNTPLLRDLVQFFIESEVSLTTQVKSAVLFACKYIFKWNII